ncbi:MAG: hypothetical protein QNJ90_02655, partial [Planctomycetota bacterium]|nr:hypothetical protein [Planctomycetota bacterium]
MSHLRPPYVRLALLLLGAAVLSACGGGGGGSEDKPAGPCESGGGPTIVLTGRVEYVRLVLGIGGIGPSTETVPARHVDVEVHNATSGTCYGRTSTDAAGNYTLVCDPPAGATIEVIAYSRTLADPFRDLIVHDANPPALNSHSETDTFFHASSPFAAVGGTVDVTVPYTGGPSNRPSIGFAVLDTLITCWDGATAALGTGLDRCHAYTRVGNNFALNQTSYYNNGTKSLAFLGGSAGLPDASDTDYFDDAVIAHEFIHY